MYETTVDSNVYRNATEINNAMLRVYNHMAFAVTTSMIVAAILSQSAAAMQFLFGSWIKWVVIFAPLIFCFIVPSVLASGSLSKIAKVSILHLFAAVMGISMSALFAAFTGGSIATAFMGAAVLFIVMSGWGYFTKKDLSSWGQFLFIGIIAIIIASIINIFIGSSALQMTISAIAIIIFTALTAYDTQRIREQIMIDNSDSVELGGALSLYLDFINLFVHLLHLIGIKNQE